MLTMEALFLQAKILRAAHAPDCKEAIEILQRTIEGLTVLPDRGPRHVDTLRARLELACLIADSEYPEFELQVAVRALHSLIKDLVSQLGHGNTVTLKALMSLYDLVYEKKATAVEELVPTDSEKYRPAALIESIVAGHEILAEVGGKIAVPQVKAMYDHARVLLYERSQAVPFAVGVRLLAAAARAAGISLAAPSLLSPHPIVAQLEAELAAAGAEPPRRSWPAVYWPGNKVFARADRSPHPGGVPEYQGMCVVLSETPSYQRPLGTRNQDSELWTGSAGVFRAARAGACPQPQARAAGPGPRQG